MASVSIHQDEHDDYMSTNGGWYAHAPGRCYVNMSIGMDSVTIHFSSLAAARQLYQQVGHAIAQLEDERRQGEEIIDLASDPQTDGGTVGIQPGNPTMDAHGPDPSVSYHSQAMDAARASDAESRHTEAPSAFVAGLVRASKDAEEARRKTSEADENAKSDSDYRRMRSDIDMMR